MMEIQKIKQLLQSEDKNNWTLGVMLMIGSNVTVEDMMNELYPVEKNRCEERMRFDLDTTREHYHLGYCGIIQWYCYLTSFRAS